MKLQKIPLESGIHPLGYFDNKVFSIAPSFPERDCEQEKKLGLFLMPKPPRADSRLGLATPIKVSHREKKELPTDSHPRKNEAQQAFSHELKPEESQSIQLELFLLLS